MTQINLSSVLRQVLDLWQNPPVTELSDEAFLAAANRCLTQYNIDLDLTPDAAFHTSVSSAFQFADSDAREKDLSGIVNPLTLSRIVRVESRMATSTNEDDWEEETITSFDNWNDVKERGDADFVAIYGRTGALTLVVARDVSRLQFRVVYRAIQDTIATVTTISLPPIYEPLLVYDIALEAGELIDDRSPEFHRRKSEKMQYLALRRQGAADRIDAWRLDQKGSSITHRRPFNDRNTGIKTSRRRFTVNY